MRTYFFQAVASIRHCACVCLLLPWLIACNLESDQPAAPAEKQIRHMLSYSFLEHLDEAELESADGITIEPRRVVVGDDERPAIFAHAPSTIRFTAIPVYADSKLRFGVGISSAPRRKTADGVRFAVLIEAQTGPAIEVWARVVDPQEKPEDRRWIDVEVDLDDYVGQTVDLLFKTEQRKNRSVDFSAWSLPILQSAGAQIDIESTPIRKWVLLKDLQISKAAQKFLVEPTSNVTLELAGQVTRKGPTPQPGPVEFVATVDGQPLFSRILRIPRRREIFVESIPLSQYAGREIELSLEIKFPDGKRQRMVSPKWLRSIVVEGEELPRRHATEGPNLLLVVVDTLRADHMSLYGYDRQTTPNLDRFAADSLVFTNAISQSSWTMPATASLLTGLYPTEHRVIEGQSLDLEFATIAERLQDIGFTTFGLSANPVVGKGEGFHQGFERFLHMPWLRAAPVNEIFQAFLEEHQDLRWFAYLHYIDPHDPYQAPDSAKRMFTQHYSSPYSQSPRFKKLVDAVNFGRGSMEFSDADFEYLRAAYDEEILYWDDQLGQLLEHMRQLDLLDNTVVIITSDHGEEFFDHGKMKHGPHLYDESVRVPLVFWAPGQISPGRLGQPVETRSLGQAALRLLDSEGFTDKAEELLAPRGRKLPAFSHTSHALLPDRRGRKAMASVQDDEWKFIAYVEDEIFELYDLLQDPGETTDLAQQMPVVRSRYQKLLDNWLSQTQSERAGALEASSETTEKLRALGYIQ